METPGKAAKRARDREGRFCGPRFNLEKVPRLPTFPARWALADPYGRPYFVFWTTEDGALSYSLHMARTDRGTAVQVTMPNGASRPIRIVRRPLPSGTGTMILYCCPICEKPRRYLYRLVRTGDGLAPSRRADTWTGISLIAASTGDRPHCCSRAPPNR